jgi:hypothetical protein
MQVHYVPRTDYFHRCARIRNISTSELMRRVIGTIERDQLVLAILDDDSSPEERERYQHRYREH